MDIEGFLNSSSCLPTTTMPKMKQTIDALLESGIRERVKVIIGDTPVTPKFQKDIGADFYGANAAAAVEQSEGNVERPLAAEEEIRCLLSES